MRTERKVSVFAKNRAGEVVVQDMHWGLVEPTYSGYLSDWGAKTTHARLETVAELPAFRDSWARKRRVIFPMECYYGEASLSDDLLGRKAKKQRVAIKRSDEKPLGIAGIYAYAHLMDGPLLSAAMLTRAPGKRMFDIHDREPSSILRTGPGGWTGPTISTSKRLGVMMPLLLSRQAGKSVVPDDATHNRWTISAFNAFVEQG